MVAVFSNRRVRVADFNNRGMRRVSSKMYSDHPLNPFRAGKNENLNAPSILSGYSATPRYLYTNMNSNREVLEFKFERVYNHYRLGDGHIVFSEFLPSDWWVFMRNARDKVIPVDSAYSEYCPQPMTGAAVYFKTLSSYEDIPWPCPRGTKRVHDVRKYTLSSTASIGAVMDYDTAEYSASQFQLTRVCSRYLFFKGVTINTTKQRVESSLESPPTLMFGDSCDWLVRQVDPRLIEDDEYDSDPDDPYNPIPNPKYGRMASDDRFWPFGVTDSSRSTGAPDYDRVAGILTGELRDPTFEAVGPNTSGEDYKFAIGEFDAESAINITGERIYQMLGYAAEHWDYGGPPGSSWVNQPWPYGYPEKAYDLVLFVNFYVWKRFALSNGNKTLAESGFAGGYGTAYLIF